MTQTLQDAAAALLVVLAEADIEGEEVDDLRDAVEREGEAAKVAGEQYAALPPKERATVRSLTNLCIRCGRAPACVVAQLQPAGLEVVVSHCLGFVDVSAPE